MVEYWLRQDGACSSCLATAQEGFANVPFDNLVAMVSDSDNPISKFFHEARSNKLEGVVSFGDQSTWKVTGYANECSVEFEGYTLEQFKTKFEGRDPIAMDCLRSRRFTR